MPPSVERSTYVLFASLVLLLLFWQWQPMSGTVWSVAEPAWRTVLWAVFAVGWGIVLLSTFMIGHFDLFGLNQVLLNWQRREPPAPEFKEPGFYKLVRHPIMVGFIIAFWAIPDMTTGHALFAAVTTVYILIAIQLEERDSCLSMKVRSPMPCSCSCLSPTRSQRRRHADSDMAQRLETAMAHTLRRLAELHG